MLLLERVKNRDEILLKSISDAKRTIRSLPAGNLECHRRGNGFRWYVVKNGNREYLKKSDHLIAEKLAYKHRLKMKIEKMEMEHAALKMFTLLMKNIEADNGDAVVSTTKNNKLRKVIRVRDLVSNDRRLKLNPEIERLADCYYDRIHPEITQWKYEDYAKLDYKNEEKKVGTLTGGKTVSKDETIIENILATHGLEIRKDPELILSGESVYPDWEIMDPKTGRTLYWEHFGMLDRPYYLYHNVHKLKLYMENGFYPMVNFIATFMGDPYRIDSQLVEWIVEYFFD